MKRVTQTVFGHSPSFQWFLSACGHWHREGGGGWSRLEGGRGPRLRPCFTGSVTAPGAHGETLNRSRIVPYLPLSLSLNFSLSSLMLSFPPNPPPRTAVVVPHAVSCSIMCMCVCVSVKIISYTVVCTHRVLIAFWGVQLLFGTGVLFLYQILSLYSEHLYCALEKPDLVHSSNISCLWQLLSHYFTWSKKEKVILHRL